MRLVLRIISGPEAGRTLALLPGDRRLIGRASKADLCVASDEYLSDLHAAVGVDAQGGCSAQDLCSSNGTLLNGAPLDVAVLKEGDTIKAGATEILVVIERD
jgi:pSer/pThr/pTyr-binding forkhead associated (FHA) protein